MSSEWFSFKYDEISGSNWLSTDGRSEHSHLSESPSNSTDLDDQPGWHTLTSGHWGHVTAVCLWPELTSVVTGGQDGRILFWDAATGQQLPDGGRAQWNGSPVCGLARLPGSGGLVVACEGQLGLQLLESQPQPQPQLRPGPLLRLGSPVTCLVPAPPFRPNGEILLGCSDGSVAYVVDSKLRTIVRPPAAACGSVSVQLLCPLHPRRLMLRRLGDTDGTVRVQTVTRRSGGGAGWRLLHGLDLAAGQSRPTCACPVVHGGAAALLVFGCSALGCLDLLTVDSNGDVLASLEGHPCHASRLSIVCRLTESHSGDAGGCCGGKGDSVLLATAAVSGEIKIWRANLVGETIHMQQVSVYGHKCEVTALQFVRSRSGELRLLIGDEWGKLTIEPA